MISAFFGCNVIHTLFDLLKYLFADCNIVLFNILHFLCFVALVHTGNSVFSVCNVGFILCKYFILVIHPDLTFSIERL